MTKSYRHGEDARKSARALFLVVQDERRQALLTARATLEYTRERFRPLMNEG